MDGEDATAGPTAGLFSDRMYGSVASRARQDFGLTESNDQKTLTKHHRMQP